ncbi:MAG: GTPase HflX [Planctomycetaceae bacterium]|jgi:GTP-binding protein HflX|nr:GTPase HflX [Planctomycetaceae bacterium]
MFETYSQIIENDTPKNNQLDLNANRKINDSAILVGVYLNTKNEIDTTLDELHNLADAANIRTAAKLVQIRTKPEAATYIGSGKLAELKELVDSNDASIVIFDNDLAPSQTKNLEDELKVKVIDRTELILDIFASRAQTNEAKLAVELAQLEYSLPRLKKMWTHLERQGVGGVGLRGPGEKQLEVDRRLAQKRILALKNELNEIHNRRKREVAARTELRTVSLVGYTNAGKSTLMNTLTNADVFVKNMLFATLDTRTRKWNLPGWGPVLLSDTVGFVRNLPHHLVASFSATLEETLNANLLLHVADATSKRLNDEINAVCQVLDNLNIRKKDTILILNKIDAIEQEQLCQLTQKYKNAIQISAKNNQGLEQLTNAVSNALSKEFIEITVEMSIGNGKLLASLAKNTEILSKQFTNEYIKIHCRTPKHIIGKLKHEPDVKITYNQNINNNEKQEKQW